MKTILLSNEEISLIQRFNYERDGFKVLIKEFTMDSILDIEFSINETEWNSIKRDYLAANDALMMVVNTIAKDDNAFKTFSVDFNHGILSWEG